MSPTTSSRCTHFDGIQLLSWLVQLLHGAADRLALEQGTLPLEFGINSAFVKLVNMSIQGNEGIIGELPLPFGSWQPWRRGIASPESCLNKFTAPLDLAVWSQLGRLMALELS